MTLDIDQTPAVKAKKVRQIFFKFDAKLFGLEVHIECRHLSCEREIQQNGFFFSGEQMYVSKSSARHSMENALVVRLSQNRFVEGDKSENCKIYPNKEFESYNDCDKEFIRRVLSTYSPAFVPVWATDNMTEVTTFFDWNKLSILSNNTIDYEDLPDGNRASDCPLPCTQTYVDSRFVSKREYSGDIPGAITITFSDTIHITTNDFPPFLFFSFLSKLGGSLGLWLGVGVLQIAELLGKVFLPLCSSPCTGDQGYY